MRLNKAQKHFFRQNLILASITEIDKPKMINFGVYSSKNDHCDNLIHESVHNRSPGVKILFNLNAAISQKVKVSLSFRARLRDI